MKHLNSIALSAALGALFISSTTMAALYVGKVTNLSKTKPLTLKSISIKSGERKPAVNIPPEKSAFFSITDKQNFLTFVYGYADSAKDPVNVKGPAATCVMIMTGEGKYRINATNPDKVECKISEDLGGVTINISDKAPEKPKPEQKASE